MLRFPTLQNKYDYETMKKEKEFPDGFVSTPQSEKDEATVEKRIGFGDTSCANFHEICDIFWFNVSIFMHFFLKLYL